MLEHLSRRSRSLLSLTLTTLALALSILALCTSYWCEGTHKVVKPLCLSPVKMKNCGQNNSEPYTTGIVLPVSLLLLIALLLYPSTFWGPPPHLRKQNSYCMQPRWRSWITVQQNFKMSKMLWRKDFEYHRCHILSLGSYKKPCCINSWGETLLTKEQK